MARVPRVVGWQEEGKGMERVSVGVRAEGWDSWEMAGGREREGERKLVQWEWWGGDVRKKWDEDGAAAGGNHQNFGKNLDPTPQKVKQCGKNAKKDVNRILLVGFLPNKIGKNLQKMFWY
jgi:hypothetical protein